MLRREIEDTRQFPIAQAILAGVVAHGLRVEAGKNLACAPSLLRAAERYSAKAAGILEQEA